MENANGFVQDLNSGSLDDNHYAKNVTFCVRVKYIISRSTV